MTTLVFSEIFVETAENSINNLNISPIYFEEISLDDQESQVNSDLKLKLEGFFRSGVFSLNFHKICVLFQRV